LEPPQTTPTIPEEPKDDATATDTTTPTDEITDVPAQLKAKAPSFIMADDAPDFNLSAKELNMIVRALGIGQAKPKTKKKK
jgi:hypothetical protein